MAKSTFLALCQTTSLECGLSGSGPSAVSGQSGMAAKIVKWVADADMEIQSRWFDWDFLHVDSWSQSITNATTKIDPPTGFGVWDEESFYLDYSTNSYIRLPVQLDYRTWRNTLRNGVKSRGKPSQVIVKPDRSLILEPLPSGNYSFTADYWKAPVRMTVNGDTSQIPEEYERIIVARAKMYYAEHDSAPDTMRSAQIEHDDLLDKLESKYLPSQRLRRSMASGEQLTVVPA